MQVDFGVNAYGKEILTLTNLDQSILCVGKGSLVLLLVYVACCLYRYDLTHTFLHNSDAALLVTHVIVMSHIKDIPHKPKHTANVMMYHQTIWSQIKATVVRLEAGLPASMWVGPALAVPALAVPIAGRVRAGYKEEKVREFPKGAQVHVVGALKAYEEFKKMKGVVVLTVKQLHFFVCVRLESQDARDAVKRLNGLFDNKKKFPFLKDDELDLLCCKKGQVERLDGGGQDATDLGKRKASEDSSEAGGSGAAAIVIDSE
jgi:hypothetical protein